MTTTELPLDERQQKGLIIAATMPIKKQGESAVFVVPSQSLNGKYRVDSSAKTCSCPDFELRQKPCKHVFAVEYVQRRETTVHPSGATTVVETQAVRVTYAQPWTAYNRAQVAEKELFCHLLRDLCAAVPSPVHTGRGRPPVPLSEALFSACYKVYSSISSRRFMTDLRDAKDNGHVETARHFNTVLRVIGKDEVTPVLHALVEASAAPLKSVESTFAVDSTGFGTQNFYRHFTAKYGHDVYNRDYLKLHALVGVKTNVIAAATVTDRNGADSPQLQPLLEKGAEVFDIARLCADKAYSSRKNVQLVAAIGADALIPFHSNAKGTTPNRPRCEVWEKLFHFYNYQRDEFLKLYHARSNAESVFSSMKRVFGDTLRSKKPVAQGNELLMKVIAHNIRCLVHSIFELNVTVPGWSACTQNAVAALNPGN
jgi:transposase